MKHVEELLQDIVGKGSILLDEPMKNHTSFCLGGPCDVLVIPESLDQLEKTITALKKNGVDFFLMGNGSNLIVRDKGIRGVVIKTLDKVSQYKVEGETIEAEAGILLAKLSKAALEHDLAGLEFASGIPGTLGGAVVMNAGAYGGEMKDVVVQTEYIDSQGNKKVLRGDEHQFAYRSSLIQQEGGIVLKSTVKLKKGNRDEIKALMLDLNGRRKDKQPLEMPSAGSVFKRPEGYFVGKLVEDCGLRGYKIGGAQVSEKHCGFIVNAGNAKTQDVIDLINHIKTTVKDKFGVELHTEVKIVGEE